MSIMSMPPPSSLSTGGGLQQSPKFFQSGGPRFQSNFQKSNHHHHHHHHHQHHHSHQVLNATQFRPLAPRGTEQGGEFDGKRLRKAVTRRTIDYNAACVRQLQLRVWQRDRRDHRAIQPDYSYYPEMVPPPFFVHNPINAVTTKFVRTSTNKMRCPIFCVAWTPEGRRLVTGASSGEFTLWNGLTFNFETILQAHDSPVRCMVWGHTDQWMVTGDHAGFVKYWQSNMNNVKMFQAHKEPLRGISFCPTDTKFATCSDDGTVRIWDFLRCYEEKILRGHGADVKCVAWHPQKALLVSGSKDSQQPIKLWDPKSGQSLATLHAHKSTVMEAKWNDNGNWLLTGSRDHLIKLFDIRKLSQEVQTFRGHKKEVSSLAWHPMHESLFASGGSDGALMFWLTGVDKEVGSMEQAHDSIVWSLDWHPLGHILCSGSNDHTCKFWTRNRPGDKMRDKYNLNMMPIGSSMDENSEYDDISMAPSIPGMGMEQLNHVKSVDQIEEEMQAAAIPGLDFGSEEPQVPTDNKANLQKKIPYSKPIPRQFQQQWMDPKPLSHQDGSITNQISVSGLGLPPGGDGQNTISSMTPGLIPLPPQHVVQNMPPPPVSAQQAFGNRIMGPADLSQAPPPIRVPMMWPPRPPGMSDGQMRPPFPPPIGNGNQFSLLPPPVLPTGFGGNPNKGGGGGLQQLPEKTKSWKEFGDSDFRVQMDSDMRLLSGVGAVSGVGSGGGINAGSEQRQDQPGADIGVDFDNSSRSSSVGGPMTGGDDQDKDMRTQLRDTDARVPHEFQTIGQGSAGSQSQNNSANNDDSDLQTGRRGRWGAFVGRMRGGGPYNASSAIGQGDLDERLVPLPQASNPNSNEGSSGVSSVGSGASGLPLPPPSNFCQPPPSVPRKRGWDVGPGMADLNSQNNQSNHRDGAQQNLPPSQQQHQQRDGPPPPHMQSRDDQDRRQHQQQQQPRFIPPPPGMPPWGPPMRMGMRGPDHPPPWFRGGPFMRGPPPPRGRMGMGGPFPPPPP